MFDRNDRFLKREAETLGWLDLPELGRKERVRRGRVIAIACIAFLAALAALALAAVAAG